MGALLTLRPSSHSAVSVLRDLFGQVRLPFAFRLWDGTEVRIGEGEPSFTVVFKSPEIFGQLMQDPSPGNFAEAYAASAVDIEGDLFQAMSVADVVEELEFSLGRKLRVLWTLWRG